MMAVFFDARPYMRGAYNPSLHFFVVHSGVYRCPRKTTACPSARRSPLHQLEAHPQTKKVRFLNECGTEEVLWPLGAWNGGARSTKPSSSEELADVSGTVGARQGTRLF